MAIQNTYTTFPYKNSFSFLSAEEYLEAAEMVKAMWSGVFSMWGACDEEVRTQKRQLVLALLIAWYLADMYPTRLLSGTSDGGRPIAAKSIQLLEVSFRKLNLPDVYDPLSTNQFGVKAAMLLHNAPDMMGVYGGY